MVYMPRHQPQLGRGIAVPGRTRGSRDCGPRTGQMMMDAKTKGRLKPGPVELREKMGTPGPQETNIWDMKKGVESYKGGNKYRPMRYYIKRTIADTKAAIRDGKPMQVCIHYGKWNDLLWKTGDPNFTGGHSIGVYRQKKLKSGTVMWLVWDPLDDARRSVTPAGPRWVKRAHVVAAMVAFGGSSTSIYAGVISGGGAK